MAARTPGNTRLKSVAVIGGGISGLAAAHRLVELAPELRVIVLESRSVLGGLIQTRFEDGYLLEHGAENFLTEMPWATDLCRRIGFFDELIPTGNTASGAMVVCRGRLQRIPDGFVVMAPRRLGPTMASRVLSLRGKIRLALEPLISAKRGDDDESVAAFARRRLGREAYRRLVEPLVGGIYTGDPERLSLRSTLPRFGQWEREYGSLVRAAWRKRHAGKTATKPGGARYGLFAAPQSGMGSLISKLAERLPDDAIQLDSPVQCLRRLAGGEWLLDVGGELPRRISVDAVVLATPAALAAELLEQESAPAAAELRQIEHTGCGLVSLGFGREQISHPLDTFGFVVPAMENRRILSASFSSIKYDGRAPRGSVLVRVFLGGAMHPELVNAPEETLICTAVDELASLLGIEGAPRFSYCRRLPSAMPQYCVGHEDRVRLIDEHVNRLPGLALAGNAYRGVGIPQCIHSGETAAQSILSQLNRRNISNSGTTEIQKPIDDCYSVPNTERN